jgi:predicted PurR-regulated permease PerM
MLQFDKEENKVVEVNPPGPPLPLQTGPVDKMHNRYFFLAIIIIFGLLLYYSLSQFFTAFLGAVIIYILSRRFMDKLIKKRHWKKGGAAMFVIFISVLIIMVPIGIVIFLLYNKGKYYIAHPELLVESLKKFQVQIKNNYGISVVSDENIAGIKAFGTNLIKSLLNESLNFFGTITMLYFFLYFMLININRLEASIVFFLPFKRNKIELFGKELVALTYSNSIGVPAIGVAQGVIAFIGYTIAGVPEAGFWAVITGFSSIIPIIGTGLIWLPITVYLFVINHTWQGAFMFIWGLLVLGITDNVVRFMLAKKMADVHPIITVLGVIMGLKFFGITGLIFGPVLISFFIILLKIYHMEYHNKPTVAIKKKTAPVRFNLPFLGQPYKKKKPPYAGNRSNG